MVLFDFVIFSGYYNSMIDVFYEVVKCVVVKGVKYYYVIC